VASSTQSTIGDISTKAIWMMNVQGRRQERGEEPNKKRFKTDFIDLAFGREKENILESEKKRRSRKGKRDLRPMTSRRLHD